MDARRNLPARLLAGLQMGIAGGLATLIWFASVSEFHFRAPWTLINLFSASFRGNPAWGYGFSFATVFGVALHLFACGSLGMLIGWMLPRPSAGSRISLTGAAFGAIVSLMVYEFFWRRQVPRLNTFTHPGVILVVHLLIGACFSQFPRYFLRLAPAEAAPQERT